MQLADRDSVWSGCYSLSLLYKFTSDMGGEGGFDALGGGENAFVQTPQGGISPTLLCWAEGLVRVN